ncbi:uncharacterized protein AB675_8671 [Cyphellophora attinorum]|uniref:MARVEL domain-containing protein n=1 Tax=Cyphellophora attinorum TaxID=1664694 RepID=A0A0N1P301_9EURO|nr:uncharacterized protein AB675_8671 [Phialophora attinorum]KPI44744.1 hypothetical protein AB675_8671 [Phialophora attinorum]
MKMVTTNTSGTPHVIPMPRWSSIIGIARLVLAVLVLAFVAAAAGLWGDASYAAFGLTLFTASATLLVFAYYTLSLCRWPHFYSAWAVLGLEIFGVIFWLTSFALCAEWTATFNHSWWTHGSSTATNYGFWNAPFRPEDIGLQSRGIPVIKRALASEKKWKSAVALMGTAAGLGAVQFVLFVVTLTFFGIGLQKHRVAGKPFTFKADTSAATPAVASAPAEEKAASTKSVDQPAGTASAV